MVPGRSGNILALDLLEKAWHMPTLLTFLTTLSMGTFFKNSFTFRLFCKT